MKKLLYGMWVGFTMLLAAVLLYILAAIIFDLPVLECVEYASSYLETIRQ